LTSGRKVSALERSEKFHYSPEVWQQIEKEGPLAFDLAGLDAILADIRTQYRGEEKPFLTGWGQGGSITWTLIFTQPERWRTAAPACPYFEGLDETKVSQRPERADLQVQVFQGESDFLRSSAKLDEQWEKARQFAEAHGFKNISRSLVPDKYHDPLADEVVEFFKSRLKT
jgi:dienelactone hydrolase